MAKESSSKGQMQVDSQRTVTLTTLAPEQEDRFEIRWIDWDRIQRLVERITPRNGYFRDAAFCFLGIAMPGAITAITYLCVSPPVSRLPVGVWGVLAVLGLVIFVICFAMDRRLVTYRSEDSEDILYEMRCLEPPRPQSQDLVARS